MMFRAALATMLVTAAACTAAPDQQANRPAPAAAGNTEEPQSTTPVVNHADYDAVPPIAPLPPGTAPSGSCAAELGTEAATKLATECRAVSPATRPPCNPANGCDLIRGEIARGCAMLGEAHRPAACDRAEDGS